MACGWLNMFTPTLSPLTVYAFFLTHRSNYWLASYFGDWHPPPPVWEILDPSWFALQDDVVFIQESSHNGVFSKWFHWIQQKNLKIKKEDYRVGTQDLLCKRQRLYHSATEPQATEQILILNLIHASVISQILWILWIHWKFCSI